MNIKSDILIKDELGNIVVFSHFKMFPGKSVTFQSLSSTRDEYLQPLAHENLRSLSPPPLELQQVNPDGIIGAIPPKTSIITYYLAPSHVYHVYHQVTEVVRIFVTRLSLLLLSKALNKRREISKNLKNNLHQINKIHSKTGNVR